MVCFVWSVCVRLYSMPLLSYLLVLAVPSLRPAHQRDVVYVCIIVSYPRLAAPLFPVHTRPLPRLRPRAALLLAITTILQHALKLSGFSLRSHVVNFRVVIEFLYHCHCYVVVLLASSTYYNHCSCVSLPLHCHCYQHRRTHSQSNSRRQASARRGRTSFV